MHDGRAMSARCSSAAARSAQESCSTLRWASRTAPSSIPTCSAEPWPRCSPSSRAAITSGCARRTQSASASPPTSITTCATRSPPSSTPFTSRATANSSRSPRTPSTALTGPSAKSSGRPTRPLPRIPPYGATPPDSESPGGPSFRSFIAKGWVELVSAEGAFYTSLGRSPRNSVTIKKPRAVGPAYHQKSPATPSARVAANGWRGQPILLRGNCRRRAHLRSIYRQRRRQRHLELPSGLVENVVGVVSMVPAEDRAHYHQSHRNPNPKPNHQAFRWSWIRKRWKRRQRWVWVRTKRRLSQPRAGRKTLATIKNRVRTRKRWRRQHRFTHLFHRRSIRSALARLRARSFQRCNVSIGVDQPHKVDLHLRPVRLLGRRSERSNHAFDIRSGRYHHLP